MGELAVLDGLPRSATVLALRDSELLFVSKAKFDQYAHNHPELYQHLLMLLASRLGDTMMSSRLRAFCRCAAELR